MTLLKDRIRLDAVTQGLRTGVPELLATAGVPGLSVALIRDGAVAWTGGFGQANAATGEPVTPETVFEAASLTKPVYAYAALRLCERGWASLDRPLIETLPAEERAKPLIFGHVVNEPRLGQLTMRHVLCHTSGFPNWAPLGQDVRLALAPGERYSYSGEGYQFLQQVIEAGMHVRAESFVRSSVLEPLAMSRSRMTWSGGGPVALGHDDSGAPMDKMKWTEPMAAASLHCTASDYARMVCALMCPPSDRPHLGTAWVDRMLTPETPVNDSYPWDVDWPKPVIQVNERVWWGLGWAIQRPEGPESFFHWGSQFGYRSLAVGFRREGIGLVLMGNSKTLPRVWREIVDLAIGGEHPALDWLGTSC